MREGLPATAGRAYMRKLGLFALLCCSSMTWLVGCSGVAADPAWSVVNRNIMLIPSSAPGYKAEPDAPLVVVCGRPDPRNPQMDLGAVRLHRAAGMEGL
jgi:hypothetical protein